MSNHYYTRARREARHLKTYNPMPIDERMTELKIGGAL